MPLDRQGINSGAWSGRPPSSHSAAPVASMNHPALISRSWNGTPISGRAVLASLRMLQLLRLFRSWFQWTSSLVPMAVALLAQVLPVTAGM